MSEARAALRSAGLSFRNSVPEHVAAATGLRCLPERDHDGIVRTPDESQSFSQASHGVVVDTEIIHAVYPCRAKSISSSIHIQCRGVRVELPNDVPDLCDGKFVQISKPPVQEIQIHR